MWWSGLWKFQGNSARDSENNSKNVELGRFTLPLMMKEV